MNETNHFEVIIIGGSYAGLSAAMALGRSLRSVLIIDSKLPCNRQAPHSHNFITHDGEKPGTNGERAFRLASLINNLTNDITILTSGKAEFDDKQIVKLNKHNIKIIETEVLEIEHENGNIKYVVFKDG